MATSKTQGQTEVLIVEDSPTQAEQLRHLLEMHGYLVVSASNGFEAMELAESRRPALVVTDIVMPEMDGYELCRRLKSQESSREIPVVLLTSLSDPEDVMRGLECGADNFLRKPYDEDNLVSRIAQVLESRTANAGGRGNLEISIGGRSVAIGAERRQILDLLLSTYEELVHFNDRLRRSNLMLHTQYLLSDALNRAAHEDDACTACLETLTEIPAVRAGWIALVEEGRGYRIAAARGLDPRVVGQKGVDVDCRCSRPSPNDEFDRVTVVDECPLLAAAPPELKLPHGHVSVPLWVGKQGLGILNLVSSREEGFSDEVIETLRSAGNQVGIALERMRLNAQLQNLVLERTRALSSETEQRKRAQASQERLAAVLEATTDLVAILDSHGTPTYLNRAGRTMLAIDETIDLSTVHLLDMLGSDSDELINALSQARQEGTWRGETNLSTRSGIRIPVSLVVLSHSDPAGREAYFSAVARDISSIRQAEAETKTQLERLAALRSIDIAITSSLDLRLALNVVLEQVTARLGVDAASVLVLNRDLNTLEPIATRGFSGVTALSAIRLGDGLAGRAALERRMVHSSNLPSEAASERKSTLRSERFVTYYAAPLVARGQVNGVLELFHRVELNPEPQWLDFLEALAGQTAISVDVVQLFDGLQRSNTELSLAYDATIEGWSLAMDLRDKETEGHTLRVTELSLLLARRLGFTGPELVQVRRGALLHDIGKIGIPDRILLKPGRLTDEEWIVMRKHPQYAFDMLSPIRYLRPALDIPHYHHERWDGSGYPDGLAGERIPLSARVFAIVDVWDALRSDRPYRAALSREETIRKITTDIGTHFDPNVGEAFLALLAQEANR